MASRDMTRRVLLVSMPFASVRYPSPALSLLKPLLEREGLSCDVGYLNIVFQAYTACPDVYEVIADLMVVGEWVFGEDLFGENWARSHRARVEALDAPLLPEGLELSAIRDDLVGLRSMAGSFIQECMDKVSWNDYSIIGFTSVFSQHVASLALARRIKERWPDKIIAFGGANCDEGMGKALLRLFPFVDWVFSGEADLSCPRAVTQWLSRRSLEGVPGVAYRRDGQIIEQSSAELPEMDSLPYPDFDDYFTALKKWAPEHLPFAPISLEFSRGCWWGKKSQCIFCGLNRRALGFRPKSPQRAEAEIKALTARYKTYRVILTDSILDMRSFKTLLPALGEWGALEELFLDTKANLTREQLRLLKSAGVTLFQPGIESLDSEILAHMRKGTTLWQNVQFLKWARQYGLYPAWNLLCGFPGENPEAYRRMASLVPSIFHLQPPAILTPVLLVRFSPLFEQSQQWGLKSIRAHAGYRSVYPFGQEDLDELAYFFDYDFDGRDAVATYIAPLRLEIQAWQQAWQQQEPPVLAYERQTGGGIVIRDTRPCRLSYRVELQGEMAMAYLLCDATRHFDSLANEIRQSRGEEYSGDSVLRRHLDELCAGRLMLREGDRYLSLAISSTP